SAGAYAGGSPHPAQSQHPAMSVEVQTPSSVDESAPWLTGQAHLGGWTSSASSVAAAPGLDRYSDAGSALGASSGMTGWGEASLAPVATAETTEYWLIGSPDAAVGSSAGVGASGSVGFDSASASHGLGGSGYDTAWYTSSAEAM